MMRHLPFMWRSQELGQADQVIGSERQRESGIDPLAAAQLHLGQTRGALDPTEHLFDPFSAALADVIADMASRASIDRGLARRAGLADVSVDSDVRRDPSISQVVHELRDVIGLVRPERDPSSSVSPAINQIQRSLPLGGTGGLADAAANRQAMTVLDQRMPHIKLGRLPVALLVEPSFRVGRALVRLV